MSKWSSTQAVHDGHDPQLERAVAVALQQMKDHPCAGAESSGVSES